MVGCDQPGDDCLPQSRVRIDDDLVVCTGDRIRREQHAGELGGDHALDHDGQLYGLLVQALALALERLAGSDSGGQP